MCACGGTGRAFGSERSGIRVVRDPGGPGSGLSRIRVVPDPGGPGFNRPDTIPSGQGEDALAESDVAASATPTIREVNDFRYTNGESPRYVDPATGVSSPTFVLETYEGKIEFGASNLCWYLDATFCSYFHRLKNHSDAENVKTISMVIIFVLWGLAGTVIALQIGSVIRHQFKRGGTCRHRQRILLTNATLSPRSPHQRPPMGTDSR